MTTPISNNNTSLAGSNKSARADEKGPGKELEQGQVAESVSGAQEDAVSVSRAAQVLSEQPVDRGQGVIQSSAQAAEVARGLKGLIEENPGLLLVAQAKAASPGLGELLKAS